MPEVGQKADELITGNVRSAGDTFRDMAIAAVNGSISGADAGFYMHGLKESALIQSGMSYENISERVIK